MDPSNHLKSLLQNHLATDASAIRHLPYCLSTLTPESLQPSAHLTKWTNRIHSLLHSKESGGRWAGLCLAYKSSLLSQSLMIDAAQSWISVSLPLLSRNESLPTIKAAVRLLRVIFSTAIDILEFERQVSIPNVVKFTGALIPLADNHSDIELKILCMDTMTRLIPIYPTIHRVSASALSAFTLRHLSGSPTGYTYEAILASASQLYSVLPLTGGKVGATNLWRKSLDEVLAFGWEAFYCLRTTFPIEGKHVERPVPRDEPQLAIPLNQDRLRCSVVILSDLLRSKVERPVQVPIGSIVKFIIALLTSTVDDEVPGFMDPTIRAMEVSVVPDIWNAGCNLLVSVSSRFPYRLDADAGRLLSILAYQLEQTQKIHCRLSFIKAISVLLENSYPLHSSVLPNRIAKAILPSMTKIIFTSTRSATDTQASSSKSKNSKKRARNYEGDEVFKVTRQVLCSTAVDEQILSASIDVIKSLFRNPELSPYLQSLISRIVTSILVALPRISPSSISQDLGFIHQLNAKIQEFSLTIASGTSSAMSKTLPFVIESALICNGPDIQRNLGLLIHPRVPPLVQSLPQLEALSLFREEQSQEEIDALTSLGVQCSASQKVEVEHQDVVMGDHNSTIAPTSTSATDGIASSVVHSAPAVRPVATSITVQQPQATSVNAPLYASQSISQSDMNKLKATTVRAGGEIEIISNTTSRPKVSQPVSIVRQDVEDEDEEMPAINMDSDSEDEGSG